MEANLADARTPQRRVEPRAQEIVAFERATPLRWKHKIMLALWAFKFPLLELIYEFIRQLDHATA
jgi:hypothetical protein